MGRGDVKSEVGRKPPSSRRRQARDLIDRRERAQQRDRFSLYQIAIGPVSSADRCPAMRNAVSGATAAPRVYLPIRRPTKSEVINLGTPRRNVVPASRYATLINPMLY